MADVVDSVTRSRMMSGIRGKDTKPELLLRRGLHRLGFRYRLHGRILPGKPDLVFQSLRAVIFVHGCFWHGHDCHLFKWPSSRSEFWKEKIDGNRRRDVASYEGLERDGWRVLTLWECAIKGRTSWAEGEIANAVAQWLTRGSGNLELQVDDDGSAGRSDRLDG